MPTSVKDGSTWKPVTAIFFKQGGAWVPVQRGYTKVAGTWVETFASAVTATISATTANLNLSSLFSIGDWQSTTKKKIVVIAAGVIVGSANPAVAALVTGTAMGGLLELLISGEVQGAGGVANGGTGGDAINNQLVDGQLSVHVNAGGAMRSGGGGGGKGGAGGEGGGGSATGTIREPESGENYTPYVFGGTPLYLWSKPQNTSSKSVTFWGFVPTSATGILIDAASNSSTSVSSGGYTYYRGTFRETKNVFGAMQDHYGIYRTYTGTVSTTGGAGGAGGDGGRGRGYQQTLTTGSSGAAGAAGGTNAGAGGVGGDGGSGGDWGAAGTAGSTGATGAAGNAGSGAAGSAGSTFGAAGRALFGAARTLVNNGTINGAVI